MSKTGLGALSVRPIFWAAFVLALIVICAVYFPLEDFSGQLGPHHFNVSSITFAPDGKTIAAGVYRWKPSPTGYDETPRFRITGLQQTVAIVDAADGVKQSIVYREPFKGRFNVIQPEPNSWATYSRDGRRLVIGSWKGVLTTWNLAQNASGETNIGTNNDRVQGIAFSPDGAFLAVIQRGAIEMRDASTLRRLSIFDGGMRPRSLSFSPDSQTLAVGGHDLCLVEVPSGRRRGQFYWDQEKQAMFLSLDNERYAVKNSDGSPYIQAEPSEWVAYAPDGQSIATSTIKRRNTFGSARIIDLPSKTVKVSMDNVYGPVRFSPDGNILVVGGYEGLSVFDAESGKLLYTRRSKSGVITSAISPDGMMVVSGDTEGRIQAWNMQTSELLWETFLQD